MAPLRWKAALGSLTVAALIVAEVGYIVLDWSDQVMAPVFALLAAVVHSVTLIPSGQGKLARPVSVLMRFMLVAAVLFSANHWLLSQATPANRIVLDILSIACTVGVCTALIVAAVQEVKDAPS